MTTARTPRVWIGELARTTPDGLIGEWVEATDADEMHEAQKRVAAAAVKAAKEANEYPVYFGEPEEFFIADYDEFGSVGSTLGEYPDYETVARIGALIEEHGEAFLGFVETCEPDLETVDEDDFHEAYRGVHDSEGTTASSRPPSLASAASRPTGPSRRNTATATTSFVNVIEELSSYIDWERVARDDFLHGPLASRPASGGGIHVYDTDR